MSSSTALKFEDQIYYIPEISPQQSRDNGFVSGSLFKFLGRTESIAADRPFNEVIGAHFLIGYFERTEFITSVETFRKLENLEKLVKFALLEKNWDGEGGKKIPKSIIKTVKKLITDKNLIKQPFIAPLSTGGILLTFRYSKFEYMNVFLRDSLDYSAVEVDKNNAEHVIKSYPVPCDLLHQKISQYYENKRH